MAKIEDLRASADEEETQPMLRSMLETKEGWQATGTTRARAFHFIREGVAICGKAGLYTGDLIPDVPGTKRGNDDCAPCFNKLRAQQRARAP